MGPRHRLFQGDGAQTAESKFSSVFDCPAFREHWLGPVCGGKKNEKGTRGERGTERDSKGRHRGRWLPGGTDREVFLEERA